MVGHARGIQEWVLAQTDIQKQENKIRNSMHSKWRALTVRVRVGRRIAVRTGRRGKERMMRRRNREAGQGFTAFYCN